jgi:hypothetical protein
VDSTAFGGEKGKFSVVWLVFALVFRVAYYVVGVQYEICKKQEKLNHLGAVLYWRFLNSGG